MDKNSVFHKTKSIELATQFSLSLFRWRRSAFRKRINFRLNDQSAIQAPTAWEVWTRAADNVVTITLTFNSRWWKSFSLQALITPTFHWYPSGLDTRLDLEFGRREFFSLTHKKRFPTNSAWRKAYIVFCALHQPRKSFGDAWTSMTISQSGRSMKDSSWRSTSVYILVQTPQQKRQLAMSKRSDRPSQMHDS